jgi:hypothetical protein
MEKKISKEAEIYNSLFMEADNARSDAFRQKKKSEEFYFSNVDGTYTEFDTKQLEKIKKGANIPVSTKITWAIIEHLISFLTASKPYPRLVAPTEELKSFAMAYAKLVEAVFAESDYLAHLNNVIRDVLTTGSGYFEVCKSSYYDDSALNVAIKYLNWKKVIVDPNSEEDDFDDARFICIADLMPRKKAQDEFDITIPNATDSPYSAISQTTIDLDEKWHNFTEREKIREKLGRYVFVRRFYEQEISNVYVSDDNEAKISKSKPKPIQVDNPKKIKLKAYIEQLVGQMTQMSQLAGESQQDQEEASKMQAEPTTDSNQFAEGEAIKQQNSQEQQELQSELQNLQEEINRLKEALAKMPNKVTHYNMTTVDKEEVVIENYRRIKQKLFKKTIMINDEIIDSEYMPYLKHYPIVHFSFSHMRSPYKTFGIVHYIRDMVMAINKTTQLIINDMMINGNQKLVTFKGQIQDKTQFEEDYAKPGAVLEIEQLPNLPDGGRPLIIQPGTVNQAGTYLLERLQYLVEYATGISALQQGHTGSAPDTLGATQSLLSFGSQRVKLYARKMEKPLERLVSNVISYAKMYTPKDQTIRYLAENNKDEEIFLEDTYEDLDFKVRVEMQKGSPTHRAMAASLLGSVSGQTQNPHVADLLTTEMLKNLDIVEGDEFAEKIDVIKNLQQQLAQMEQQLKETDGKNKALENQLANSKIAQQTDLAVEKAKGDIELEKQQLLQPEAEQQEELNPPF